MDDTFTILESPHKTSFLEHLNSIDHHIQFTSEEAGIDGSIPFLDVLIMPDEEGNLKTTVYRKPTHRLIPSIGQQPPSLIKVQCDRFLTTQS